MGVGAGGVFSAGEAASATGSLLCSYQEIKSLKGAEFFTSIKILECWSNQLTELDISHNSSLIELNCSGNQLTQLDVSTLPVLKTLRCGINKIVNLKLNTNLIYLDCRANQLEFLDLSKIENLIFLDCTFNQFPTLSEIQFNKNLSREVAVDIRWNFFDENDCGIIQGLVQQLGEPIFQRVYVFGSNGEISDYEELQQGLAFSPQVNFMEFDCISSIKSWALH